MKNRNKELLINTIIIFLGKASTQLLSFLLLPLYTTFLSTSDYGAVDLIITYIQLLVPVLTLEIEMAAFRFILDNRNESNYKGKIIYNVLIFINFIGIAFIILYLIVSHFINFKYKLLILLNILISMYSNSILQIARGLGENIKYSLACFINGLSTVISNVVLIVLLKLGAEGMLISMLISNAAMIIYLFWGLKIKKLINTEKDKKLLKEMTKYSVPLVPNLISWWIISVSDRTIISLFLDLSINGIYSVANKFSTIFIGVYNVFNLSWTESASLHYNDDDRDIFFSNTINNSFKIFASFCIGIIALLPFVFSFIVNENYNEAYYQIPILLLGTLCNVVIGLISVIYVAKKMSKQIAMTSFFSAIINILVNLLLIRKIGVYAASISTFFAFFSMMIYRLIDIRKFIKLKYDYKFIFTYLMLLVPVMVSYYLKNKYFSIVILIIVSMYCVYVNYKNIIHILNKKRRL